MSNIANTLRDAFGTRSELMLVVAMVGILLVLFTPIPPILLDFLLIANFSFALLILLLTFYTDKPLAFSTFPSILLIATLFRLALNVAATRLILSDAHAGEVIGSIGEYVVAGNYIIGLVVFLILIVVQYVVVTNGAQRVAEVAARFTLDAMPGKQMAIDADLNMGLIDEHEARDRRRSIEKEANFYGAMDGASKFVKGDAIAGIIIILIDIIGGLTIGLVQLGMSWGDALYTFTLLTVGDGIVTQIPSLIIATATGIIITRAATDAELGAEIGRQIFQYPKTLIVVCVGLLFVLMMPGIPTLPVLALLIPLAALAYVAFKARDKVDVVDESADASSAEAEDDLYQSLAIEPVEIIVGQALVPLIGDADGVFMQRVQGFRKKFAEEYGFVFPAVRLRDDGKRKPESYEILFNGAKVAEGQIRPQGLLAINPGGDREKLDGESTKDPSFGLPAIWIDESLRVQAKSAGYTVADPLTVLSTHFSEILKNNAADLLTRSEAEKLVNRLRETQPTLVEELVPGVLSFSDVQKVLQILLREKVSIRNLALILEALAEHAKTVQSVEQLSEHVREKLGGSIAQSYADQSGQIHVLTFDPALEQTMRQGLHASNDQHVLVLDPRVMEQLMSSLAKQSEKMMSQNLLPVLLCSPMLRRHVRKLTERVLPHLAVMSLNEIPKTVNMNSFAVVNL